MVKMDDINQEIKQIKPRQDEENNKSEQQDNKEAEGGEQVEE